MPPLRVPQPRKRKAPTKAKKDKKNKKKSNKELIRENELMKNKLLSKLMNFVCNLKYPVIEIQVALCS